MKKLHSKLLFFALLLVFLMACSTKKDRLINRQFQALNTKFNVLYNGNIALDKGVESLKSQFKDNYWEILPIERMQVAKKEIATTDAAKNSDFEKSEEKATKAIQKRSMNINGREKNPQMDEAYILLGKSRYYDQRFIPALEAFNYILYKYPESDRINEAKIWREKTNMRLENDALALKNLIKLMSEIKFKNQVFADANATLSQAYLNLGQKDSAVSRMKLASFFTKSKEEKARYHFILGQLYEEMGHKDSAFASFQTVIDMKRKASRAYVIQAQAKQAQQFDGTKGDTISFLKKFDDLINDRENRPFLDVLNHQKALFYDKLRKTEKAIVFYKKSLKAKTDDQYLVASNYRNLAKIYFDNAKYQTAGQYYDSTLVNLKIRTHEYNYIKKKKENLDDVIKYEGIAQKCDSILNILSLSEQERKEFYEDYIVKLKKIDLAAVDLEKKKKEKAERQNDAGSDDGFSKVDAAVSKIQNPAAPVFGPKAASSGSFYFYNASTVAYGKIEFKKKWGNRSLKNNWRRSDDQSKSSTEVDTADKENIVENGIDNKEVDVKYLPEFYTNQLPTSQIVIDSLSKSRNFAYYQLGVIYKEKFKEYALSASKLEQLLLNNPEDRLVLPTMYNLFKIYEIINPDKALAMRSKIISQFPNSRYAQILSNNSIANLDNNQSPDAAYERLYQLYKQRKLFTVLVQSTKAIDQFLGEEIVSKMELLKANTIGKLKGLADYKTALNFVALNYPNVDEGKAAEQIIATNIPYFEKLKFYQAVPKSWKIVFKFDHKDSLLSEPILTKINKLIFDRKSSKLQTSVDIYTMTESFVVLHGIATEEKAKEIVTILKDVPEYKIDQAGILISNENYKIVQIKKNFDLYLTTPATAPTPEIVVPTAPQKTEKSIIDPRKSLSPALPPGINIGLDDSDDPAPTEEKPTDNRDEKSNRDLPKKP